SGSVKVVERGHITKVTATPPFPFTGTQVGVVVDGAGVCAAPSALIVTMPDGTEKQLGTFAADASWPHNGTFLAATQGTYTVRHSQNGAGAGSPTPGCYAIPGGTFTVQAKMPANSLPGGVVASAPVTGLAPPPPTLTITMTPDAGCPNPTISSVTPAI